MGNYKVFVFDIGNYISVSAESPFSEFGRFRSTCQTHRRIVSFFQNSLKFPDDLTISDDAKDLIRRLLSDRKERIGYEGLANHGFFKGIDWTTMKDGKSFAILWSKSVSSQAS